ncbi:hypothetical protein [Methanolobus halotolerans]|uniref:hypothetical protein n=1 Tax=Methanolobus halotolerans TaxID=2052935 RepID=UPI00197B1C00|nr:hypothetical protein [Methanolobus halotolerans]
MNKDGVPSEEVVGKAKSELAQKDQSKKIMQIKQEMAERMGEKSVRIKIEFFLNMRFL